MVRRVTEDDWRLLRAVRLEMLADTPLAYLETVDDAEARSEGEWRFRAGRGSAGPVNLAPSHRGSGVARQMLDAVGAWARGEAGLDRLHLYVHEHNPRAAAFYRRYGFTETGATMPYDLDPSTDEIEMAMPLR